MTKAYIHTVSSYGIKQFDVCCHGNRKTRIRAIVELISIDADWASCDI